MERIIAGTSDGIREPDGTTHLNGRAVGALAATAELAWAVVDGAELWRGANGEWEPVASTTDHRLTCVTSVDGDVYVGAAEAHLLRLEAGELVPVAGFEHADGRDSWYTPWGAPPDTRSLTADATGMYVNVHVGGVLRSSDGGRSWQPTIDVDHDVHQVVVLPERTGSLAAATGASGVAISDDAGATWTFEGRGLHGTYCRAAAWAGEHLLVTASSGPFAKRGAVYRRTADGPFERCEKGLPDWFPGNVDTYQLAAAGDRAVVAGPGGSLYVSDDSGAVWNLEVEGLADIRCVAVA
jgi:hypothetical protein